LEENISEIKSIEKQDYLKIGTIEELDQALEQTPANFVDSKESKEKHEGDQEEVNQELELSFCRTLIKEDMTQEEKHRIFNENLIDFSTFDSNPYEALFSEDLCFRIEDNIVESRVAIPQIISLLAFNKELSQNGLSTIFETKFMPINNSTRAVSKIPYSIVLNSRRPCHQTPHKSNPNEKDIATSPRVFIEIESEIGKEPNHLPDQGEFR
jgi:hypothetical protein